MARLSQGERGINPASALLDRQIGERVLGCRIRRQHGTRRHLYDLIVPGSFPRVDYVDDPEAPWAGMPAVSTDPFWMDWLIGRMRKNGWQFTIISTARNGWFCLISHSASSRSMATQGMTMPHAVALAVLRTVEEECIDTGSSPH